MKGGREHRVPLSAGALAVLNKVSKGEPEDFIFAGGKKRPLSNMALLMVLRRMGQANLTVHGFRSTFRDWAAERTNFPSEVAEMALAHSVGDKVEAAYRRGDLFEKRRRLMSEWAKFCTDYSGAATVVSLAARSGKKSFAANKSLEYHLAQVERHIAEGRDHVERQRQIAAARRSAKNVWRDRKRQVTRKLFSRRA